MYTVPRVACSCVLLGSEKAWHVLQDLEIYIGKQKVEDGYALVARAGRVVQVSRPCRPGVPCSISLHSAAVCAHAITWAAARWQHVDFIYCVTLAMCTVGMSLCCSCVQEVVVKTELDPAGLKAAMQRALKRLV